MLSSPEPRASLRAVALAILCIAIATVGGALASQHFFGLVPCKLCLQQRWPYYFAVPLAASTAAMPPGRLRRVGFLVLAAIFTVSAGLGAYHAGVEWSLWPGPNDCGGGAGRASGSVGDLLAELGTVRVVSCAEAAWRFLGLSLAGWNALISLGLAALSAWAAARR